MNRKIRRSLAPRFVAVSAILAGLLLTQTVSADTFKLKIIAFNDFHGNLQSPGKFRANAQSPNNPVGGADELAAYVAHLKAENPDNVVVAAGDLISASPLVSALFHDEDTIEAMNRLGLEISSVGNHEFDHGKAELLRMQHGGCTKADQNGCQGAQTGTRVPFEGAKFQYLAANVIDAKTGKTLFPAYAIKTYHGVRVGFIGLTLQSTPTMVTPSGVAGLQFLDEASTINGAAKKLRALGVKSIVVLIHQGGAQTTKGTPDINACDGDLADTPIESIVNKLDDSIDLVISAHTHQPYICHVANSSGRKIPVTSASAFGRLLTDIDVTIDASTKKITDITAHNIVVDRTNAQIPPDANVKSIVDRYVGIAAPLTNREIGSLTADLTNTVNDAGETPLGDVIADAQLEATHDSGHAVVAFMNRGGIRAPIPFSSGVLPDGKVTYGEIFTTQPFGNTLVTMTLTGAQIKALLEEQFKGCALDFPAGNIVGQTTEEVMEVSAGFSYTWNPAAATCNKVDASSIKIGGATIDPAAKYRVATNSFLADGGSSMWEFTRGTDRVGGGLDLDALSTYFAKHPSVAPGPEDRIKMIEPASH
jgi:5'-nucleotidase